MTGQTIWMDATLRDEQGREVRFGDLVDRPTLLVFVYYRCPAICDPLLRELARTLDQVDQDLGERYRVLTVSFDPLETPEVARTKKAEILELLSTPPPDDAWRFLTGSEAEVRRLTESGGFTYRQDPATGAYIHASSLIFLTNEGRIVRYIEGLRFLPSQLELALADAATGTERNLMQTVQRLCYDYDNSSNSYVLQINRLILAVTGFIVGLVILVLVLGRRRPRPAGSDEAGERGDDELARDHG